MNAAFNVAVVGATAYQDKMDIVGNNMANSNTAGFKIKNSSFFDLMYSNIHYPEGEETDLKQGTGSKVEKTNMNFTKGEILATGDENDFYIMDDGFFAVENPETGERLYTVAGDFHLATMPSGEMYLANHEGYQVIGKNNEPIFVEHYEDEHEPAVFRFDRRDRLESMAGSYFISVDDEEPYMIETVLERAAIETSNMNFADEASKIIEAQRAFQYNLRMLQTADEIQNTINTLR